MLRITWVSGAQHSDRFTASIAEGHSETPTRFSLISATAYTSPLSPALQSTTRLAPGKMGLLLQMEHQAKESQLLSPRDSNEITEPKT